VGLHRISIFGLGRVGLVTAACFAKKGYNVIGIDPDIHTLGQVRTGRAPFFEPELTEYLKEAVLSGTLTVTQDPSLNARSDLTYMTVGTPSNRDGSIDLTDIKNAAKAIGRSLRGIDHHQIIIIKSTVTPGTARNIVRKVLKRESGKIVGKDLSLCSNPEFLREGSAIHDTQCPDRIVIGSDDPDSTEKLEGFYKEFHGGNMPPVIRTSHENAELIKYANNAFLATKISFINCIATIVERIPHADVKTIAAGIGLDQRIGPSFLNAGFGWGGSCLPKDLRALMAHSKALGYTPELIEAVVRMNKEQSRKAVQFVKQALGSLKGRRVAVLGLAFKANTDDMRQAVSITVVRSLLHEGATVVAYDPAAMDNARAIFGNSIGYASGSIECVDQCDCCIVLTEWDEFKAIPPERFIERMRRPVIVDGRRIFNVNDFSRPPIVFYAIGLGPRPS
jgi:UDPglucose 6-dehydrogenase